jgi:hypothetical protein
MNLQERIDAFRRDAYFKDKPAEVVETTIQLMIISDLLDLTEYRDQYNADYANLYSQEIIDKWKPVYERLLKLKAFL